MPQPSGNHPLQVLAPQRGGLSTTSSPGLRVYSGQGGFAPGMGHFSGGGGGGGIAGMNGGVGGGGGSSGVNLSGLGSGGGPLPAWALAAQQQQQGSAAQLGDFMNAGAVRVFAFHVTGAKTWATYAASLVVLLVVCAIP